MNQSPFENKNVRKKQSSLLANSTHYLLGRNKEEEDFNNFKSNTFYLNSNYQNIQKNQIDSYIDSLIKNRIAEQNNQHSNLINNENIEQNGNNDINN